MVLPAVARMVVVVPVSAMEEADAPATAVVSARSVLHDRRRSNGVIAV